MTQHSTDELHLLRDKNSQLNKKIKVFHLKIAMVLNTTQTYLKVTIKIKKKPSQHLYFCLHLSEFFCDYTFKANSSYLTKIGYFWIIFLLNKWERIRFVAYFWN